MIRSIQNTIAIVSFGVLSACASAAISDIATDKVKVVAQGNDQTMIMNEAKRGCAIYNRVPVPLSKHCLDGYCERTEYLFACMDPNAKGASQPAAITK